MEKNDSNMWYEDFGDEVPDSLESPNSLELPWLAKANPSLCRGGGVPSPGDHIDSNWCFTKRY